MEEGHGEGEIFSPYEAQLHALFRSCDTLGKGTLDREALSLLCNKLGLEQDQSQGLLVITFNITSKPLHKFDAQIFLGTFCWHLHLAKPKSKSPSYALRVCSKLLMFLKFKFLDLFWKHKINFFHANPFAIYSSHI